MRLRHVLASISLTAPLTSCCLREEIWHERDVTISDPSPSMMMLLATCDAEQDCDPVCREDWTYAGYGDPEIRDCEVTKNLTTGTYRITYEGFELCAAGRRPTGYARRACEAPTKAGAFLAEQAALEAASVRAFVELRADLAAHGAPRSLLRACNEAAADEVRHARVCARLARRHRAHAHVVDASEAAPTARQARRGLTVETAPRRAYRPTLRELAIDNAVEGCVRETYGAVVAGYQARAAADLAIRVAMAAIARDEAKHAQLAWRVQRWLAPRLSPAERRAADNHARAARAELHAAAGAIDGELARVVGLPSESAARRLLGELARTVWSA